MTVVLKKKRETIALLAFILNWNTITGFVEILATLPALSFLSAFSNITTVFALLFLVLTFACTITNTENIKAYIIMVAWFVLFLFSIFLTPTIRIMAPRAFIYFANNIFCIAVLLQSISNLQVLINKLKKYIPINLLYSATLLITGINGERYSMSFTYSTMASMLLCLVLVINYKEKRILYLLSFFFFILTNFKYGSRGSFVCCFMAMILSFCLSATKKQLKYLLIIMFAFVTLTVFWDRIIALFINLFPESRNLTILLQGNLLYGSGRDEIYSKVLSEFCRNPFTIRGLYSDRAFLSSSLNDIEIMWGSYSHNLFLELLYQWGIWCIPIVIAIGVYMIKVFLRIKKGEKDVKIMLVIVYSFSIGQLLISSSYLIAPSFGMLVGLLIWTYRNKWTTMYSIINKATVDKV